MNSVKKKFFFVCTIQFIIIIFLFNFEIYASNSIQSNDITVHASIDPSFTFTFRGIPIDTPINTYNDIGCGNTELTTIDTSMNPHTISLKKLSRNNIQIAAELFSINTNATNGYALIARSDSHFSHKISNFFIADSLIPIPLTQGKAGFGIHPCGLDVNKEIWGVGRTTINGAKYGWPFKQTLILASDSLGPIGDTLTKGSGIITIEYGATIDKSVLGGEYSTKIIYTATPIF